MTGAAAGPSNQLLMTGDEITSINGDSLRGKTHSQVIRMFKSVKTGDVAVEFTRKTGKR